MFVLDTNVISELFRAMPEPGVERWLEAAQPSRLYVTAVSKAEVLVGIATMPEGRRKRVLGAAAEKFFDNLRTPVLAFGEREAEIFADLVSHRIATGRPIGEFDAQIAAMTKRNGFIIVTRNVSDFEHCGVTIINPWAADA